MKEMIKWAQTRVKCMWREFLNGKVDRKNTLYTKMHNGALTLEVETHDRLNIVSIGTQNAGIIFEDNQFKEFYCLIGGGVVCHEAIPAYLVQSLGQAHSPENRWHYRELAEQVPSLKEGLLSKLTEIDTRLKLKVQQEGAKELLLVMV